MCLRAPLRYKYNNLCYRWESCQKKKLKCNLWNLALNLYMALGFQKSKIIYTVQPSLKNVSEHWPCDMGQAQTNPSRQLSGAVTAWALLSSVVNKAVRSLKPPQPGVWLAELAEAASLVLPFLLTARAFGSLPTLFSSLTFFSTIRNLFASTPWLLCLTNLTA